jgi:hypothetical protein
MHGSVLGPLLFLIFISDLDESISSRLLKFADDTKLYAKVATEHEATKLKEDLLQICHWSQEWLMLFNHIFEIALCVCVFTLADRYTLILEKFFQKGLEKFSQRKYPIIVPARFGRSVHVHIRASDSMYSYTQGLETFGRYEMSELAAETIC